MHITELENVLRQNRIEAGLEKDDGYVARIAGYRRDNRVEQLLKDGWSPREVSNTLRVPLVTVERKAAELRKIQEEVSEYMQTGGLIDSNKGGYVALFSS